MSRQAWRDRQVVRRGRKAGRIGREREEREAWEANCSKNTSLAQNKSSAPVPSELVYVLAQGARYARDGRDMLTERR